MRSIGHLPSEENARAFGDFLLVQGMPNDVEPDERGQWAVWVHDDDHLSQAQSLLAEFRENPGNPKYRQASPRAQAQREEEKKEEEAWAKRFHDRRSLWRGAQRRIGWLTATLAAVSVAVFLYKYLRGSDDPLVRALFITDFNVVGNMISYLPGLPEIRSGQVWRLVTPIFLHFGILHIVFNMMWLLHLGGMIETRQGTRLLAALIAVSAVASNLGQYYHAGPSFGGMSGVVYALFGYVWVRSKLDPASGLFIDSTSVIIIVGWFFLCLAQIIPYVANTAHAVGFGVGLVWGFLAARFRRG